MKRCTGGQTLERRGTHLCNRGGLCPLRRPAHLALLVVTLLVFAAVSPIAAAAAPAPLRPDAGQQLRGDVLIGQVEQRLQGEAIAVEPEGRGVRGEDDLPGSVGGAR